MSRHSRTRRTRFWLASAALAIAICLVLVFEERGPFYQGRSAEGWLEQLTSEDQSEVDAAMEAVSAMGTNVIPLLLSKLGSRDSTIQSNLAKVIGKHATVKFNVLPARENHQQASRGFAALGPQAEPAIPGLMKLLSRSDVATHAAWILTNMDDEVIPWLLQAASNANPNVRSRIIHDLGNRHSTKLGVLETLLKGVADTDAEVRRTAVYALRNRPGHETSRIVPALLPLLKDTNAMVRGVAATMVGDSQQASEQHVPTFLLLLDDQDDMVRSSAAQSLGNFGQAAAVAVPKLLEIAQRNVPQLDPSASPASFVRLVNQNVLIGNARRALWKIDPAAAERAGVPSPPPPVNNEYE